MKVVFHIFVWYSYMFKVKKVLKPILSMRRDRVSQLLTLVSRICMANWTFKQAECLISCVRKVGPEDWGV